MHMKRRERWIALAGVFIVGVTIQVSSQVAAPARVEPARSPLAGDAKAITQGAVLFRQE